MPKSERSSFELDLDFCKTALCFLLSQHPQYTAHAGAICRNHGLVAEELAREATKHVDRLQRALEIMRAEDAIRLVEMQEATEAKLV